MTATSQTTKTQTDAELIADAYQALATRPGDRVRLLAIMERFDMSVPQFHAALRALVKAHAVNGELGAWLEAEPKQRDLTELDHLVAFRGGGEPTHLLVMI